jgi:CheY-like chemotaxis protein
MKGLSGKRVGVIDDQADNIFVLLTLLKQLGATGVVVWWTADQVSRTARALPLDAIMLDLMLPGSRSGYAVIEELRAIPGLEEVPIVAVSAADTATALPKARELGFDGFISKPIDSDLFPQQMESILNGEPVWAVR